MTWMDDTDGLIAAFQELSGRRFLGPIDGVGCVELVFAPSGVEVNLVTIYPNGQVLFGFVSEDLIESGYVEVRA